STYSDAQVNAVVNDNSRITVTVSKLVAGTIYNPVQISLSKTEDDEFLSVASEIKHGLVYTYPVFSIISMAADEFYLKIEPYKGYKGYYTVYSGATTQTMSKWAEYEDKAGGTTDIFLPVNLNAINNLTQFFKVNFEFTPPGQAPGVATATLDSQILKYTPDETDIVINTPLNLEITKQLIVENAAKNGEELMLSLKWDISYVEILKNLVNRNGGSLSVEYLFNRGEVPYDTDEKLFSKITLDMTLNGDDLEITMKDDDGRLEEYSWTTREMLESGTVYEMAVGHITLRLPISAVGVSTDPLFEYPGIYFLNTRAQYYLGTTHYKTSASIPIDMTLDSRVSIELARPQNLKTVEGETDNDSFAMQWDTLDYEKENSKLYTYRVEMLETRGFTIGEDSVLYNLYITTDKELMDKFVAAEGERDDLPETLKDKVTSYDNGSKKADSFDFVEIGKISDLRKGNIVKIENIMQDNSANKQGFEMLGLDENMEYYVVMETVLIPVNMETEKYDEKEKQISKFSTIISATTQLNPENPKESEKNPAVPTNFDKEKVTLNSASLKWDRVKEVADPLSNSTLEYQFIRITGQKMDDNLIDSRLEYNETWSKLPTAVGKAGCRTSSGKVYEYMPYESGFSHTVADSKNFTYDNSGYTTYYLKDMTLIPNELYFYYIRTVRISDGNDEAYSVWVPLSVTTTPVDSPTNLKVLPEYKRDAKTEIAIGFTLPELPLEKLGNEYLIQYSTKQDTDEWTEDKTMAMSDVTVTKNADGTLYCEYLIDGLKEGTMYSIRVRLYNTLLKDSSLYSNTAQARTDLDQDDYDKKKKQNDWINHYIDLLEQLVTNPYWVVKDTTGTVNVVYRPNSFSSVIASSPSGVIDLYKGELDAEKKIYYLPSKAIKQAYDADKGFRISYKDSEVVFSARSIDPGLNDAIIDINKNIAEHSIDDYFVKLTVTYNTVSYDIDGSAAIGPVVNIEAEAVGSKKNIEVWDKDMVAILMNKIADEEDLDELAKDIEEDVYDEESNKKLVKLIKQYVTDFEDDFEDEVDKEINKVVRKNYVSTKLNKNIIIANAVDSDVSVSGNRQQNGTWTNVEVSGYGTKKAIYTLEPGTYAFSGKKIAIPGITNVPNGGAITQMVVKYSLDDYFGKDTSFNLNAKLTKNMAVGAAARIAGAKKGDNPITYFNSKGINVSTRGNTNATTQEAIYLAMASYQIRTGVKVDSIRVTNYKNTADATGLQPAYKKSVQAAYSMGAYNNNNLQPNEPMTVKDFLQILVNLKM
ncbi:MAG: fibronectin type III domain-containing protein, partial [Firmicutes bacterium]|nr:fibronectin type III domain-containing protein [Bacillota bacterium]